MESNLNFVMSLIGAISGILALLIVFVFRDQKRDQGQAPGVRRDICDSPQRKSTGGGAVTPFISSKSSFDEKFPLP